MAPHSRERYFTMIKSVQHIVLKSFLCRWEDVVAALAGSPSLSQAMFVLAYFVTEKGQPTTTVVCSLCLLHHDVYTQDTANNKDSSYMA